MAAPGDPQWKARIAEELGVNLTPEVSHFFDAWARAEGGNASNNPFNTTQNAPGATTYNSVGVRNYTSPDQGIAATAQTLQNGRYGNIMAALKKGASARDMAEALANSPWGTGALVLKVLGEAPSAPPSTPTRPGAPGMESAPQPVPLPGMQQPAMMSSLQSLINNAAPSQGTRNILASLGGTAAKVAQASSAPITIPTLPRQRQLPNYDPGSLPGVPSNPAGGQAPQAPLPPGKFKLGDPVVSGTGIGTEHGTSGLDGYPAHDYFAPAGSKVAAPIGGKIIKLSGHDPKLGAVEGAGGPLGWSVYIQGNDGHIYYLTHMGSRNVQVGATVKAGQVIGTVANYDKYGRPSHIHMGVH